MNQFRQRVESLVAIIPKGKVMTYGQIAAICGNTRASRTVGSIAHYGKDSIPWHRVVNRRGGLASGYPGGREAQKRHLDLEGVKVSSDYYVKLDDYLYDQK